MTYRLSDGRGYFHRMTDEFAFWGKRLGSRWWRSKEAVIAFRDSNNLCGTPERTE